MIQRIRIINAVFLQIHKYKLTTNADPVMRQRRGVRRGAKSRDRQIHLW